MEDRPECKIKTVIIRLVLTFIITAALLLGLMVLVTMIPRRMIKDNMQSSAEYLENKKLFGARVKRINGSKMDYYADSVLLGIIWQLDGKQPLKSVMETGYYSYENGYENKALLSAVKEDRPPNKEYLRYWHGSAVYLKPLFIFLNLRQIYIFNACVLIVLLLILLYILFKQKAYVPMVAIVTGLILTSAWFVPMTLEYTWCFMLMLLSSTIVVKALSKQKTYRLAYYFLIFGMLTAFLDFLTTELITLFVPLLLVIWFERHKSNEENDIKKYIKYCIQWLLGYVFMWTLKWAMAAIILKRNVWTDISAQIEYRINGEVPSYGKSGFLSDAKSALLRNLRCLFPVEYGTAGWIAGLVIFIVFIYFAFVCHKSVYNKKLCCIYLITASIPYLRYVILCNHSYLHCFFTYRAQLITVFALVLFLEEFSEIKIFHKERGTEK